MAKYNKSVTFEITTHSSGGHFSIPKETRDALGITTDDPVHLVIKDAKTGEKLFEGKKEMRSGAEIYGSDVEDIGANRRISVTVKPTKN